MRNSYSRNDLHLLIDSRTFVFAFDLSIPAPSTAVVGRTCASPLVIASLPLNAI